MELEDLRIDVLSILRKRFGERQSFYEEIEEAFEKWKRNSKELIDNCETCSNDRAIKSAEFNPWNE